jgi:hypothetical protein
LTIQLTGQEVFLPDPDLDYGQVESVSVDKNRQGTWTFSVTLRHNDQGWDHYADKWIVVNPLTEENLGERVLKHPHDQEQPFTRSLSGVIISEDLKQVEIRAKCTLHGYEGQRMIVMLESPSS